MTFNPEVTALLVTLVLAVVKAVLSHLDAKKAKGTADEAKALAAATESEAAAKKAALDALVLWIEAQKAKAPPTQAKATSQSIKAFAEQFGVQDALRESVDRLTKVTPSGLIATPKEAT